MSKNVPMDHDGKPSGLPAMMAATPSVAAHLSTHTAKRKWVLYAVDCFVAQCHEVTCDVMITMDFGISPGCYQVGGVKTLNYSGNSVVK